MQLQVIRWQLAKRFLKKPKRNNAINTVSDVPTLQVCHHSTGKIVYTRPKRY